MQRTHRWAARSLSAHRKKNQAIYGVVQGSVYEDLRKESATYITSLDFDGIAIGGVSVGESKKEMKKVLEWVVPFFPDDKSRHLLGVGEIDDIFSLVEQGIDTFDCVQPTRLARMGRLLTRKREIDITKDAYAEVTKPIEKDCGCYTCQRFSQSYLHHLFRVRELLAYRLATIHNIHFINTLMGQIRHAITQGKFLELKKKWLYNRGRR
jgi:tRNA-guanine transglycosylase